MLAQREEAVRKRACEDADLVKLYARFVVKITPRGVRTHENRHGKLDVIAIIGPGKAFGLAFEEAILSEIGISSARPYRPAKIHFSKRRKVLRERRKWFSLTEEQYRLVAPVVFSFMQEFVNNRVRRWQSAQNGNRYWRPLQTTYYCRGKKKIYERPWRIGAPLSGLRFKISRFDRYFLADAFWAEFHGNSARRHLGGLARYIDLCLSRYKRGYSWSFKKLRYVRIVEDYLSQKIEGQLPGHLIRELPSFLPRGTHNKLYSEVVEMVARVAPDEEHVLANQKPRLSVLPNPAERTSSIELHSVSEFGRTPRKRNYVSFEVLPSLATSEQRAA